MTLLESAIRRPVTVVVGAILVVLFGLLAALRLPVQITPTVEQPLITVETRWEGASPQEIEREIIQEQEDKLKSAQGLYEMTATAIEGRGTVQLEFTVGTDVTRALLEVSQKLKEVPSYPENVDEPVIRAGETEGSNAIAWFILERTADSPLRPDDLPLLRTTMVEQVKPRLEQAQGVARVEVIGGVEREVHVEIDPFKLAARSLTLLDVRAALVARNVDISGGNVEQGKRSYTIRTIGKFSSLDEIDRLVLARRGGAPVYLSDVGRAELGYKEAETVVRTMGEPAIAINATRQSGTNVIAVMDALQLAVGDVNDHLLGPRGLVLRQVYDETEYIYSAIDLVLQNLWVGGLLAIAVLLLFLRSPSSTLVIAIAIPISVIGSFLGLAMLGRNLNVISLAGLAFAVGMVVDASIVVLENIYRHRQEGKPPAEAARIGAGEVYGAVLASTLTTLAVFIPVVFVEEEAGQLFADIAIAISAAVGLSLVVSVLFVPMAAARLLGRGARAASSAPRRHPRSWLHRTTAAAVGAGSRFRGGIADVVAFLNRSVWLRLATVLGFTGASVLLSWLLLPPMSYLPEGNRNLVIGFLIPPPGYNPDAFIAIAHRIEPDLRPYWEQPDPEKLAPEYRRPAWYQGDAPIPPLDNFFYVARGSSIFMGARSMEPENVKPIEALMVHAASDVPGAMVFASQRSLFQRGVSAGNSIDLQITGFEMPAIEQAALALMGPIMQKIGPPRPEPSNFAIGGPEVQVQIDHARAADLGLSVRDVGFIVQAMVDGAIVSDYRSEGVTIDVKLLPVLERKRFVEQLDEIPIATPVGRQIPLSAIATLVETTSPNEIRHVEEKRAVKLIVTPPEGMELSTAMDVLQDEIIAPMRASGVLPPTVSTRLAGTADKLVATREALQSNFLLALVITYLLMAALFESFLYPFVIMLSVPLAAVGGILGLRIVHELTGQQMDVLTMLGFVILIGTVVNNAILIVAQALDLIRNEGADADHAVVLAVRTRVRPIFMSTLTSVLGMLPLVLFPGAGSELYRGLGSVVVGGLLASTVFTLLVVPTMFSLALGGKRWLQARIGRGSTQADAAPEPAARETEPRPRREPVGSERERG